MSKMLLLLAVNLFMGKVERIVLNIQVFKKIGTCGRGIQLGSNSQYCKEWNGIRDMVQWVLSSMLSPHIQELGVVVHTYIPVLERPRQGDLWDLLAS